MVELCRSRSESTRPRIGVRNAAFPDFTYPSSLAARSHQPTSRCACAHVPSRYHSPAALSRHLGVSVATFMLVLDISAQAVRRSTGGQCLKPSRGLQKGVRKLPDIWTEYPEIVRDLLREAGFSCGVEPRILKGRDPDWTCIIDGQRIGGDIYIHQADTILGVSMGAAVFGLFGALIALLLVVLWQTWVIISLKRKARGS
jgi:hypothetical protein